MSEVVMSEVRGMVMSEVRGVVMSKVRTLTVLLKKLQLFTTCMHAHIFPYLCTHSGYCRIFLQSCVPALLVKTKLPIPPPQLAASAAVVTSLACKWLAEARG